MRKGVCQPFELQTNGTHVEQSPTKNLMVFT